MALIDMLCARIGELPIRRDVPMRTLTTFGLGGPADAVLFPREEETILRALKAAAELGVPVSIMGNGSNLLVRDGGVRGLVIAIGSGMTSIQREGTRLTAEAGVPLTALSKYALEQGLMGLEWACGIPGTLGGACAMNAGAYGGNMQQALHSIRYLENGEIKEKLVLPHEMDYRQSEYAAPERVVLRATLQLAPDDGGARERQAEYVRRRSEKQPLSDKSAGSTFKRPPGHFAGVLIEGAGLKGARIGGAVVSEKHAGFLINDGAATASDMLKLIAHVRKTVDNAYGIQLSCELKIWGEDAAP